MAVGAKKDLPRLLSNYGRLGINLLMGLVLIPVLGHWLGESGLGLFGLVFQSVGLALLFDEVTRSSLIRELARAYHANDHDEFRKVYNTGLVLSAAAAVLSSVAFVVLWFLVPYLKIDPNFHAPARALVLAEGISSFLGTLLSPINNMFVVSFRFISDNFWQVLRRSSYVISACFCAFVLKIDDVEKGFMAFVLGANAITVTSLFVSAAQIMIADKRMIPHPRWFDRATLASIWPTVKWNTLYNLAMNLYERTAGVMMNLAFGLHGNVIWMVALQLASYVRMVSLGVNSGIDAVSAKISVDHGEHGERMSALVRYGTVLHALVALPVAALIFGLADPVVRLWVGRTLSDPDVTIPEAVMLTRILLIPITVRAISDCWTRILYGAGFVASFARMVLVGGVLNPVIAWTLLLSVRFVSAHAAQIPGGAALSSALNRLPEIPDEIRLYIPAITFAAVYSFFHFFLLPIITVRCLRTRRRDIFAPMIRPIIASALGWAFLVGLELVIDRWTIVKLGGAVAVYGVLMGVLAFTIALTPSQRGTILNIVRRKRA